jgi:hypothetical protein
MQMNPSQETGPLCSFCGKEAPESEIVLARAGFHMCHHCVTSFELMLRDPEIVADRVAATKGGPRRLACSVCGKTQDQSACLFGGGSNLICDSCVRLCADMVNDDLKHPGGWDCLFDHTAQLIPDDQVCHSYARLVIANDARVEFAIHWRGRLSAALLQLGAREVIYLFAGRSRTKTSWFVVVAWKDNTPGETLLELAPMTTLMEGMRREGVLCGKTAWYSVCAISHKLPM